MEAAAAAQYGDPPPPELVRAWRIQQWGPPDAGGWLDWPAGWIDKMGAALNTYNAMAAYASAPSDLAGWLDRNPQIARTVGYVLRERMRE